MQLFSARFAVFFVVLLVAWCAPPSFADADADAGTPGLKPVDVYILSGQSNMVGSGQAGELPEMWQRPIEGAYLYRGGAYEPLVAGKDGRSGRFGPEVGFGHYLRHNHPGRPEVYLVKFALGGQPLDAGWGAAKADGGGWAGPEPGPGRKTFYPGKRKDDPNIGNHYKRLHRHVSLAMENLRVSGYKPNLRGIVWMQGEADAKHAVSAGRYDQSLALLKKRMEADFGGGADVPFVFGQVLPHDPALERFTHRGLIRQRMTEADWRSGSERSVANMWMVPTEGMELMKDTVHYSTKGQLALGQAFGLEMLKAHRQAEDGCCP